MFLSMSSNWMLGLFFIDFLGLILQQEHWGGCRVLLRGLLTRGWAISHVSHVSRRALPAAPMLHGDRTPTLVSVWQPSRASSAPELAFVHPPVGLLSVDAGGVGVVNEQQKYVKLLEKYVKTVIVSGLIFMGLKFSSSAKSFSQTQWNKQWGFVWLRGKWSANTVSLLMYWLPGFRQTRVHKQVRELLHMSSAVWTSACNA